MSALRKLRADSTSPFVFVSERGGPLSPDMDMEPELRSFGRPLNNAGDDPGLSGPCLDRQHGALHEAGARALGGRACNIRSRVTPCFSSLPVRIICAVVAFSRTGGVNRPGRGHGAVLDGTIPGERAGHSYRAAGAVNLDACRPALPVTSPSFRQ